MKEKVVDTMYAAGPFGSSIRLVGEHGYLFDMAIPAISLSRIYFAKDPLKNPDTRKSLSDVMEPEIVQKGIEELYINEINDKGVYTAEMTIKGQPVKVIPSEGLLLAIIAGSPIYFDTDLPGTKHQSNVV